MSRIMVTGGAGFIGSALVKHLLINPNNTVLNIDKLSYASNLSSLSDIAKNERYSFANVNLCDSSSLAAVIESFQPSKIMHLAAETHVDRSINAPKEFVDSNIFGTFNLLQESLAFWSNLKQREQENFRIIHVSTDEVFGDLGFPNQKSGEEEALFNESSPYVPSSPYSASKASSDHLVRAWNRTYGLPCIVTNCSNNYGPFQNSEKLIPLTIKHALFGIDIPIYGNGEQMRDWLYVDDHVKALELVAEKGKVGDSYNIGANCEERNIDLVKRIIHLLQEEALSLRSVDNTIACIDNLEKLICFAPDRPGHDKRYAINSEKIRKELGWLPTENLSTGLRKTVNWYYFYFKKNI